MDESHSKAASVDPIHVDHWQAESGADEKGDAQTPPFDPFDRFDPLELLADAPANLQNASLKMFEAIQVFNNYLMI